MNVGEVERWLADQRAAGTKTRTSNHYAGTVKAFCNWMVADGRTSSSPLSRLRGVAVTDEESYGAFTVKQMQKLLNETRTGPVRDCQGEPSDVGMSGPDRRLLYRFAVETALRAGEIRTLTAGSFKLDGDPPTVELKARGCDFVDVSSGGNSPEQEIAVGPTIRAKKTPLNTKAMWMVTFHMYMSVLPSVGSAGTSINVFSKSMAEIATMAPMTFSFNPLKSIFPIQSGRS